jgi:hypothetical protein
VVTFRAHSGDECKPQRGRPVPQFFRSQRVERGERAGIEALRGDSARLRTTRESSTKSKGSRRLFEVRGRLLSRRGEAVGSDVGWRRGFWARTY